MTDTSILAVPGRVAGAESWSPGRFHRRTMPASAAARTCRPATIGILDRGFGRVARIRLAYERLDRCVAGGEPVADIDDRIATLVRQFLDDLGCSA